MPPFRLDNGNVRLLGADELPREVAEAWLRDPCLSEEPIVSEVCQETWDQLQHADQKHLLEALPGCDPLIGNQGVCADVTQPLPTGLGESMTRWL